MKIKGCVVMLVVLALAACVPKYGPKKSGALAVESAPALLA